MYIITQSESNIILDIFEHLAYQDNGYPMNLDTRTAYVSSFVDVYENVNVNERVVPHKYCYTPEAGFYINENYVEPNPYGIPDELVAQIKNDAITEVEEAVLNGTY